jgi:hypothetical protein
MAVMGFRALFWIPHALVVRDSVYILAGIVVGLGLPLGVGILGGRPRVLRVAEVYLALGFLGMCALFGVSRLGGLPAGAPPVSWWALVDLTIPLVLLILLVWSRIQHGERNVEPGAAPNGGPATQLGNSDVAEGPPSVS